MATAKGRLFLYSSLSLSRGERNAGEFKVKIFSLFEFTSDRGEELSELARHQATYQEIE